MKCVEFQDPIYISQSELLDYEFDQLLKRLKLQVTPKEVALKTAFYPLSDVLEKPQYISLVRTYAY